MAQGRKTGGRTKGVPNKKNAETVAKAQASGMLPHEFLCAVSQGQPVDGHTPTFEERLDAAKAAAPYYAPKLSSIEAKHSGEIITGGIDAPPRAESYEEWNARRQRELAAVGTAAGSAASSH